MAAAAAHFDTHAQKQNMRRIGVLFSGPAAQRVSAQNLLRDALRRLGYKEGENLLIDWRFVETAAESVSGQAESLVSGKVELIVTVGNPAAVAAKHATHMIPIVMWAVGTPVETGLVQSLARPGGNITGTTYNSTETAGKVLQILRDVVPAAKTVAVLWDPEFPGMRLYAAEANAAATAMGIRFQYFEVTRPEAVTPALGRIAASRPDALYVALSPVVAIRMPEIAAFAIKLKLVSIGTGPNYVTSGGLLYYGPNNATIAERTASYVDRILRGAAPADLPVEQPTTYEFVINTTTAKALGLVIPQTILARADRIVE